MAALIRTSWTGDKELKRKLERAIDEMPKELRKAVQAVVQPIFEVTQQRVPVKDGDLKATGRMTVFVSPKRDEIGARIVYGGPEAPYARRVHEDLEAEDKGDGRGPKFVERPVHEAKPRLGTDLAREIDLRRVVR